MKVLDELSTVLCTDMSNNDDHPAFRTSFTMTTPLISIAHYLCTTDCNISGLFRKSRTLKKARAYVMRVNSVAYSSYVVCNQAA